MFKEDRSEFRFEWAHLGNINVGRPNMGPDTSVAVYRLMQYTLRDAAIKYCGAELARRIVFDAGCNSGKAIYAHLIGRAATPGELAAKLQRVMKDLRIGILRLEHADEAAGQFTFTVYEDLDCSGLPLMDEAVCTYDEGVIAGVLEAFAGVPFNVREMDCWGTGQRVCRFFATPREP